MLSISVDTLLSVTEGELLAGPAGKVANDVCIDSREVPPGCVFIALPGERADGHDFLADAVAGGARVLVVTRAAEDLGDLLESAAGRDVAIVRVADGTAALQALARHHRGRLHCEVVGITGSTGKTTTKEFVNSVLSTRFRVVSTDGNRNNEIGVPLTVLQAGADTDVLVVEMGMRGTGQIRQLCDIARPGRGLITNVGTSHIELLGSQDAVADAKAELVESLPASGVAFLNGDDAYSARIAEKSAATVVYYGLSGMCDVLAEQIEVDADSHASFDLVHGDGTVRVTLGVPGRYNVYNALAAAAVGLSLGIAPDNIAAGLAAATLPAMRMQVFESASGVTVVNDAYNANPVSMRAAIETLADMHTDARRVAVLGDMAELGSLTELAHFGIGEQVARLPIDALVTVGERAMRIAEGARAEGMAAQSVRACETVEEASEVLDDLLSPGDVVLVKASRVMGLEAVVEGIVNPR